MAAYANLVSLMHIINNLELHPRPPISLDKNQVDRLSQKITFLQNFLEGYNPSLGYSIEADPLESRIVDAACTAEYVIESHIVDKIIGPKTMNLDMSFADHHDVAERKFISSDVLYDALEKLIQEMALIEKEAMEIKHHTVGVQFQHKLHSKSTSPDSLGSSSSSSLIAQHNKMVGADELLLEMKDRLKSDRLALQIIPIVGMGGSDLSYKFLLLNYFLVEHLRKMKRDEK